MVANRTSIILQSIITLLNITADQEAGLDSYNYYYMNLGKAANASKCYGSYGCFELSYPWTSEHRPVSLFPEDINKVDPRLTYYTRENPIEGITFDLDAYDIVATSGIDPMKHIYLISHGYMEGGDRPWIRAMTKELLHREDCNVIVLDWHGGSSPPYTQAVANIRLVGAITAHFFNEIAQYTGELGLEHVHCIGHSLGAHLSGYIGYTLQDDFGLTLGRITGMDPAEPHFAKAGRPVRLDRSAARFVDIIHTDASQFIRGGLGMTEPIGHVDYYPNGGTNQPGCDRSVMDFAVENGGSLFHGIKKFLGCNHVRSHEIFSESINTKCPYLTISCNSYEDFKSGKCFECGKNGQHCMRFGYHSLKHYYELVKRKRITKDQGMIQYLMTGDRTPFCKAHYKVTVHISDSNESKTHGGEIGQLWFTMHGTKDQTGDKSDRVPFDKTGYHEPGSVHTSVIAADYVKNLSAVEVEWDYNVSVFNPLTWRILTSPRLFIDKVTVESLESGKKVTVCPKAHKPLINGISQLFLEAYCN